MLSCSKSIVSLALLLPQQHPLVCIFNFNRMPSCTRAAAGNHKLHIPMFLGVAQKQGVRKATPRARLLAKGRALRHWRGGAVDRRVDWRINRRGGGTGCTGSRCVFCLRVVCTWVRVVPGGCDRRTICCGHRMCHIAPRPTPLSAPVGAGARRGANDTYE